MAADSNWVGSTMTVPPYSVPPSPVYSDSNWVGINATIEPYVAVPIPSDSGWATIVANVPPYSGLADSNWVSITATILPSLSAHQPVGVFKDGTVHPWHAALREDTLGS